MAVLTHKVLLDTASIAARVATLAGAIVGDTGGADLTVIGLLTGSFVFVADLVRALAGYGVDAITDFMAVSHYGTSTRASGLVQIRKDTALDIRDQNVLLVDDILDTGLTLTLVRDHLVARAPRSLRVCILLDKPERRVAPIEADYVGFVIPDRWVVGYGLDMAGHGRGLPYVAVVDPQPAPAGERAP